MASQLVEGAMGIDDIVTPVLCLLDHVYAAEEAAIAGEFSIWGAWFSYCLYSWLNDSLTD